MLCDIMYPPGGIHATFNAIRTDGGFSSHFKVDMLLLPRITLDLYTIYICYV